MARVKPPTPIPTPKPKPQPQPEIKDTPVVLRRKPADPWDLARDELAQLEAELPIALLPIRLETRFAGDDLLVRVYPDAIHGDTLRRALDLGEREHGETFWKSARREPTAQLDAWRALIAAVGNPWRAAWIMRETQRPKETTTDTAEPGMIFRLLPRRWVVVGTLAGDEVIRAAGREIPADLHGGVDLAAQSDPDDESLDQPATRQLLDQPATRWIFEFDQAVAKGMALRIPLTGAARTLGLDTLLVFGASSRPADDLRKELEDLLESHHYTRGAGFMAQGEPTNRTATDPDPRQPDPANLLARELADLPKPVKRPAGPVPAERLDGFTGPAVTALAQALGIADDLLGRFAGAPDREQELARAMNTVTWPVTIGGLLWSLHRSDTKPGTMGDEGKLLSKDIEAVREHFLRDVRGAGPLPTLRLGATPYGFLPVCGLPLAKPDQPPGTAHARLQDVLHHLLPIWQQAAATLPVIDPGADDSAADGAATSDLAAVLAGQPWPSRYAVRTLGRSSSFPFSLRRLSETQEAAYRMRVGLLTAAGLTDDELPPPNEDGPPAIQREYDDDVVGWAASVADLPPVGPLDIRRIAEGVLIEATVEFSNPSLLLLPQPTSSSDESRRAAQPTTASSSSAESRRAAQPTTASSSSDESRRAAQPTTASSSSESRRVAQPSASDASSDNPSLLLQLADLGRAALRDPRHPAGPSVRERELVELNAAVTLLQGIPRTTRARILGQSLSLAATRLDAWITATATRRLAELRNRTPTGLLVGGWGVVHDLRPAGGTPSGGYALTPSLGQAAAAVALRSGHAAYSTDANSPFAVDLSSERVRLAHWLYDGVRQGQSLAVLLGQRFERILHEHGADSLIRVVREAALKARSRKDPPVQVVDGLLVARALTPTDEPTRPEHKLATDPDFMRLTEQLGNAAKLHIQAPAKKVPLEPYLAHTVRRLAELGVVTLPAKNLGDLVLEPLRDALDALADTAMFEATHQMFTGERSAAATTLAAVDRGEAPPPALRSLDTPRGGVSVAHRVVLLLAADTTASPWPAPPSAAALAEPRLERWAAALLGMPAEIRVAVEHLDQTTGALRRRDTVTLAALAPIAALDFCRLAAAGQWQDGPLATRLLADKRSAATAAGEFLRLGDADGPLAASEIDLAEAHALAARLAIAWRGGRPATAAELSPLRTRESTEPLGRTERAELSPLHTREPMDPLRRTERAENTRESAEPLRRIDRADLKARLAALRTWLSGQVPQLTALAQAQRPALLEGIPKFTFGAPLLVTPDDLASETDELLRARVVALAKAVDAALRALATAEAASDNEAFTAFTAAVGPLVGDGVPLLPVYAATTGVTRNALGNLVPADELQISSWLGQLARVRPRIDALDAALKLGEARHVRPPFTLRAGQTGPADTWAAIHRPVDDLPCVCITAVLGAGASPDGPLAALALDSWSERVPARDQLAGLAMQYQSPAASAPQVVLLATPSPGVGHWSLGELQRAAASALTLAQIRPVTADRIEHLGHLLPCIFLDGSRIPVDTGGLRQLDFPTIAAAFTPSPR